jgi:hypothetical protein
MGFSISGGGGGDTRNTDGSLSLVAIVSQYGDPIWIGIALGLLSVFLIVVGLVIQRYALSRVPREEIFYGIRWVLRRDVVWLAGLTVYFTANVFYTIALAFTPASLLATLVATIVPLNALTSRVVLGETLEAVDMQGGVLIMLGIALAAYAAPYTSDDYTAEKLEALLLAPQSIYFFAVLLLFLITLATTVLVYEHSQLPQQGSAPRSRHGSQRMPRLRSIMPFAYPIVVGLLESIVQVAQKGGSSMLALTLAGQSQMDHVVFSSMIGVWLFASLTVVWWLRKGLANLPATRLLPIEYGTFTSASVMAGLLVYDEQRFVSKDHLQLMVVGVVLVALGCAAVGSRCAVRVEVRCTSDDEEYTREQSMRRYLLLEEEGKTKETTNGHGRKQRNQLSV